MKFVVTVRNQSTAVTKEITFPICGSWKIRRMSCGKYRVYNYTLSTINYNIYDSKDVILESATSPSLSYDEFNPTTDGVFKLTTTINGEDLTAYIFNFCELEKCIVELQQKVLLDNVCDECKMDKVLYQKALRLIPIYETWKKLLDKDNIYSIQYTSTDQSNLLADIYNSEELYKEIKILCDACSTSKKCNC